MPHDAIPRNGRMYGGGAPAWKLAIVLALAFSAVTFAVAVTTGLFVILVPGLAAVGVGIALFALLARRRTRAGIDWNRVGMLEDDSSTRRRSRWRRR